MLYRIIQNQYRIVNTRIFERKKKRFWDHQKIFEEKYAKLLEEEKKLNEDFKPSKFLDWN